MSERQTVVRMIRASIWAAFGSLFLMLLSTTMQLAMGRHSGFTLAVNIVTIGILSGTATLLGKVMRSLNQSGGRGDQA